MTPVPNRYYYTGRPRTDDANTVIARLAIAPATMDDLAAATGIDRRRVGRIVSGLVLRLQAAPVTPGRARSAYRLTSIERKAHEKRTAAAH